MFKNDSIRATGRRKNAIAQVRLLPKGEGKITVNKKPADEYFRGLPHQLRDVRSPIELVEGAKGHDYVIKVIGGGISGQAGAARHAISRALVKADDKNKKTLKAAGFLTRDPRMVERKKSGQPKARKRFQYSKR
ncbi:MAG: 30S ribosomal protein S9 [Elusimicrobia bacterium]|nr:30S ribosomal protein S9 [Elusimicrobiota bacterium]